MKLFVANFPSATEVRDLFRLFSRFGEVRGVSISWDRKTQESRGWGFVEMALNGDAESAIDDLDGVLWRGKRLNVRKARPRHDQELR
jgi:RNA recognition motif-containing protein